jgi:hypothetical protein
MKRRLMTTAIGSGIIACGAALVTAGGAPQRDLDGLTVPAAQLPAGCRAQSQPTLESLQASPGVFVHAASRNACFDAIVLYLQGAPPPAKDLIAVGAFDNVRQTESDHCYGWSLTLWRFNGRLLGLLNRHAGLCGDEPCEAVADVSHDTKTGRLSFSAFRMPFSGTVSRSEVSGTFGAERLRLRRSRNQPSPDFLNSLSAWCTFWRGVSRCTGVTELCSSLGAAKQ